MLAHHGLGLANLAPGAALVVAREGLRQVAPCGLAFAQVQARQVEPQSSGRKKRICFSASANSRSACSRKGAPTIPSKAGATPKSCNTLSVPSLEDAGPGKEFVEAGLVDAAIAADAHAGPAGVRQPHVERLGAGARQRRIAGAGIDQQVAGVPLSEPSMVSSSPGPV